MESEVKTVTVDVADAFAIKSDTGELCRLCANTDNQLMPIFRGEGLEHSIATKIEKYLPIINVTELDKLPLQICYQCASTLIAWNNLYEGCRVADKRLREILCIDDKLYPEDETFEDYVDDYRDNYDEQTHNIPTPTPSTSNLESNILRPDATDITQLNDAKTFNETELDSTDERYGRDALICGSKPVTRVADAASSSSAKRRYCVMAANNVPIRSVNLENKGEGVAMQCTSNDIAHREGNDTRDMSMLKMLADISSVKTTNTKVNPLVSQRDDLVKFMPQRAFVCKVCDSRFDQYTMFVKHLNDAHHGRGADSNTLTGSDEDAESSFICKFCDARFAEVAFFADHLRHEHHLPKYCTLYAPKKMHRDPERIEFMKRFKLEDGRYHCHLCTFACTKRKTYRMIEHYRKHTGERPFGCDVCSKWFTTKRILRNHLHSTHKHLFGSASRAERKFKCNSCGKAFLDKRYLQDHRRKHSGEVPYICHICGKQFSSHSSLWKHDQLHSNERPFKCTICEYRGNTKAALQYHGLSHTGEKNHQCDVCGRAFGHKQSLEFHQVSHSDARPFSCDLCDKRFKLGKYLRRHLQRHANKEKSRKMTPRVKS